MHLEEHHVMGHGGDGVTCQDIGATQEDPGPIAFGGDTGFSLEFLEEFDGIGDLPVSDLVENDGQINVDTFICERLL